MITQATAGMLQGANTPAKTAYQGALASKSDTTVNKGADSATPTTLAAGEGDFPVPTPTPRSTQETGVSQPAVPPVPTPSPKSTGQNSQDPFGDIIRKVAKENDLDEGLIRAVIQVESSGNPKALSRVGAQGLMQLMPATAESLGVEDPFDPEQNIAGGSRYLKKLLNRYDGEKDLALAAYNWGMGNLERRPEAMPAETRNYIVKVNNLLEAGVANSDVATA
ncbi:MAG: lytic transglycosylase domain-containing protein [Magnetococcales bacterium]|nr:lytic transglycosylase domain-containing protein [Magnetococcales bacterium]